MAMLTSRVFYVLSVLIAAVCFLLKVYWEPPKCKVKSSYDFIIVGGGTAGVVLAEKLSIDGHYSVLLLEAGGDVTWASGVPLFTSLLQKSHMDWQFMSRPQEQSCWGLNGNISAWPRGRVIGGCSSINQMLHMWGSSQDYDQWFRMGLHGWAFHDIHPHLLGTETLLGESKAERGKSGPMKVTSADCQNSLLCDSFLKAAAIRGYPIGDLNGHLQYGFMPAQANIWNGRRWSVVNGYLQPSSKRENLDILLNSFVLKILLDGSKATGILATNGESGDEMVLKAKKEVILSAGTVSTPQLLMISGVGPTSDLNKFKITQVVDLPVGHNLKDHLAFPMYFHLDADVSLTATKLLNPKYWWDYLVNGQGPIGWMTIEAVGTFPIPMLTSNRSALIIMLAIGSVSEQIFVTSSNMSPKTFRQLYPETENWNKKGFILLVVDLHPRSVGKIKLQSKNPYDNLDIDPNYLSEPSDMQALIQAAREVAKLIDSPPMKDLGTRLFLPSLDQCIHLRPNLDNDLYVECWIRTAAITAYHPIGTCAMGSVVDNHLRVKKVSSLRVVDASVMPTTISGTPHAAVIAIASRAAEIILSDHSSN